LILVDANLLLYAYHPRAEQHEKSRAWLEAVLSGPDLVRFAWLTLWAFLRIATMPADVESYSTKSRPCCLRVIDLDIILVDPWHA
jgi:predicted nucleic acid-binding protein